MDDAKGLKTFEKSFENIKKISDQVNKSLAGLNKTFKDLDKELQAKVKDLGAVHKQFLSINTAVTAGTKILSQYLRVLGAMPKTAIGGGRAAPMGQGGGGGIGGATQIFPAQGGGFMAFPGGGYVGPGMGGAANTNVPTPPGGRGRGGGPNQQQQDLRTWGATNRAVSAVADAANQYMDYTLQKRIAGLQNVAQDQALRKNMMNEMLGGDFSTIMAMRRYQQQYGRRTDADRAISARFAGVADTLRDQGAVNTIKDTFAGAAQGAGTAGPGGALVGAILGGGSSLGRQYANEQLGVNQMKEVAMKQQAIQAIKEADPFQGIMAQHLAATADVRLAGARRLGGQEVRAAGLGIGAGMGLSEAIQFGVQGANQFGTAMTMGQGGGPGLMQRSLQLQRKGFDPSMMMQMMGNFAGQYSTMGQGNQAGLNVAEAMIRDAVSAGVKRGVQDTQTLEALAGAIGETAISARGGIAPVNESFLPSFLMNGQNAETANPGLIAATMRGIQGFSQAGQQDPFTQATNRAMALQDLGPGATPWMADILGGASFQDLMTGSNDIKLLARDNSEAETNRIIELRKRELSRRMDVKFDPLLRPEAADRDPFAREFQENVQKYGGLLPSLADPRQKALATSFLQHTYANMPDFNDTMAFLNQAAGGFNLNQDFGQNLDFTGQLKNRGGIALGQKQTQAQIEFKTMLEELKPEQVKVFQDTFQVAVAGFRELTDIPSRGWDDTTKVIKAIESLIKTASDNPQAIQKISNQTAKMEGMNKTGGRSK